MGYANYNDVLQLTEGIRDRLVIKDKTEAQALVASASYPHCVYYTSDTHCIVVNGQIYGRGAELGSTFGFATDTSGMATWDTNKLYITPTSTSGTYQVYSYENNSWEMPGTITIDIPVSADAITYDLTNTPDLGEGDVQSAIEAVDDRLTYRHKMKNLMEDESYTWPMEVTITSSSSNHAIRNLNSAEFPLTSGKFYGFFGRVEKLEGDTATVGSYRFISYRVGTSSTQITATSVWEAQASVNHAVGTTVNFFRIYRAGETRSAGQYVKIHDQSSGTTSQTHHISLKYVWVMESDSLDDLIYFYRYYASTANHQSISVVNDLIQMNIAMVSAGGLGYNMSDFISAPYNRNIDRERFAYSADLFMKNGFKLTGACNGKFNANTKLGYFPNFNMTEVTNIAGGIFQNAHYLRCIPDLTFNYSGSALQFCDGCRLLIRVGDLNGATITNAEYMFQNCHCLRRIGKLKLGGSASTSSMLKGTWMLERVEELDISAGTTLQTNSTYHWLSNVKPYLRYFKFVGLGTGSAHTAFSLASYLPVWGVNSDDIPDARQSLVDSLLTYSFNRATAEYDNCTVTLSAATLAVLTEEEKTAITAKGYILTS